MQVSGQTAWVPRCSKPVKLFRRPMRPGLKAPRTDFRLNYDAYRGVSSIFRVKTVRQTRRPDPFSSTGSKTCQGVGFFNPEMRAVDSLGPGEVRLSDSTSKAPPKPGSRHRDNLANPSRHALHGFRESRDGFSGIYPIDTADYDQLKASVAKLQLNDAAFQFRPKLRRRWDSGSLRFFGLLHMEIIQERLRRE